jgi:hypothetical protein
LHSIGPNPQEMFGFYPFCGMKCVFRAILNGRPKDAIEDLSAGDFYQPPP